MAIPFPLLMLDPIDIIGYCLCCYRSSSPDIITWRPYMTIPIFLLKFWMAFEQSQSAYSFQNLYDSHRAFNRWSRNEQMDMVWHDFQLKNLPAFCFGNSVDLLIYKLLDFANQYRFPVFWTPNYMVVDVVNSRTCFVHVSIYKP